MTASAARRRGYADGFIGRDLMDWQGEAA